MPFDPDNLPQTYPELLAAHLQLGAEFLALQAQLEQLLEDQKSTQARLEGLVSMLQPSSERSPRVPPPKPARRRRKPKRGHGPTPQPDLPVVELVCELEEADCKCPGCGERLEVMKGCSEDSERIEAEPAQYRRLRIKRLKYTCRGCGHIETALGPDTLPGERRYTPGFAVKVAVDKYGDHLPLSRQVLRMKRAGLVVREQTLWDRLDRLAVVLAPCYHALRVHLQQQPVLGCDASEWKLLDKGCSKRPIFVLCSPQGAYFTIVERASSEEVATLVGDFAGFLVSDGEGCFAAAENREDTHYEAGRCLAHVRRKFVKAPGEASEQALSMINTLYAIERDYKEGRIDAATKSERLAEGWQWLQVWREQQRSLPRSKLGKALGYLDNQMPYLRKTADHPELWLDNNPSERALRRPVLGRKNHYGSRSERGLQVAAIFFSLMETCARCNVDPFDYLLRAAEGCLQPLPQIILPHQMRELS